MKESCVLFPQLSKLIKHYLFPSVISKIEEVAPIEANLLKLALMKYRMTFTSWVNRADDILSKLDNLSREERQRILEYFRALETKAIPPTLSAREARAVNTFREVLMMLTGLPRPFIKEGDIYRPLKIHPEYMPFIDTLSDDVLSDIAKGKNIDKYRSMLIEYFKQVKGEGNAEKYADDVLGLNKEVMPVARSPHFGPVREPMGIGLPPEMREKDPVKAMYKFMLRSVNDITYYNVIESNPIIGRIFGLTEDGRGMKYANNPMEEFIVFNVDGHIVQSLWHMPEVRTLYKELSNLSRGRFDFIDKIAALANAMRLGIATGLRDMVGSIGTISAQHITTAGDLVNYVKALKEALTSSAAYEMGNVRKKFTANFETSFAASDILTKLANAFRFSSGRDAIERCSRVFAAELGGIFAQNALKALEQGDNPEAEKFFEELLGKMWKKVKRDELVNLTRQAFVEKIQGNYMENLHPSLLKGGEHPLVRFVFTLQRWAYERASRFTQEAIVPVVERGDLKPLLKQALGFAVSSTVLDTIMEDILNIKPPGLTIQEWAKLGPKEYPEATQELIYHLAAKLSYAGFAGAYSMILENVMAIRFGEEIFPIENPGASLAKDIFTKVIQAFGSQGINFSTLIALPYEIFVDEMQTLRVLRNLDKDKNMFRLYEAYERASGQRRPALSFVNDTNPFSIIHRLEDYENENVPTDGEILNYFLQRVYKEEPRLKRPFLLRDAGFLNFARNVMDPEDFYEAYHKAHFEELERLRRQRLLHQYYEAAQNLFLR